MLSNFPVIRSSDPDFVRDRLFSVYGAVGFDVKRRSNRFSVCGDYLRLSGISLSYCEYSEEVTVAFPEAGFVRQLFNIEGTAGLTIGGSREDLVPGATSSVIDSETRLSLNLLPQFRQLVLRIETDALRNALNGMLGLAPDRKLQFYAQSGGNFAMSNLRHRLFDFAVDYNVRGHYYSDLATAEIERMVIVNFLLCNRHSYSDLLLREPALPSSSVVRRAEEYILANWDEPLDIATLAAVTQVSARSLFRQFRRLREYSPAEFAKRIRLQRASEMLRRCDEKTSVTQVAFKCGFSNPGHFARDYYETFGERPSATLQRAKGN